MTPKQLDEKINLPLKDLLFIGFCAVLILATKIALRLHLRIPGHSMFFAIFFLMLVRGIVSYKFSATLTGFLSGLMTMLLGIGKGGPIIIMKFLLPGAVIDFGAMLLPIMFERYLLCAIISACAASTKFIITYLVDVIMGMDKTIGIQHSLLKTLFGMLFGITGGVIVPSVIKKLKAYDVI